ncbi:hypothetical protein P152DRAFT_427205 [Eremomyces bilateralis CBS 781.70]|uniref:Asparagine synthetase domain-containing protein n=1 Tax=Eremomyces bilateralis CBS 781.70 TaxID=1392243 RepID=A0A6G1GH25_9PEZI|nr:uncharacterized protein P152DRAFT_427205 [Eremomyces bilateralis CBS 781.70]KAF1817407.1 hypothetical protein P152DRAFT_427205 [Eremomyces bilateralis CBS 781.70]
MCGIWCSISTEQFKKPTETLRSRLCQRGPDASHHVEIQLARDHALMPTLHLSFYATVLSLRGAYVVPQPLHDEVSDSVLCWNGEAWLFDGASIPGSDTDFIFAQCLKACAKDAENGNSTEAILTTLSLIRGPFAFLFYDGRAKKLWFGRDCLGRRSLLHSSHGNQLILSNIGDQPSPVLWIEIEADGVYMADFTLCSNTTGIFSSSAVNFFTTRIPFQPPSRIAETGPSPLSPPSAPVEALQNHLSKSLYLRLSSIPKVLELPRNPIFKPSRLAVLFSGGLDCTVLARMSNDILEANEPIDLLNVAFENPRLVKNLSAAAGPQRSVFDLCPDRLTARSSARELQEACPSREWRLVEIDIPFSEFKAHRGTIVSLMSPHNTEMDLSIAAALHFAARGCGTIALPSGEQMEYTTTSRVLLSGLGADELFGGYQRHATAFTRHGYRGLIDELDLDFNRLGKRNLGRDDRVTSHWSREVRYPFLDEDLVNWALAARVDEKCGFGQQVADMAELADEERWKGIEPGKKGLRLLAWNLGLRGVAMEKKRAIQFGARTAKMEGSKTKGTHVISPTD